MSLLGAPYMVIVISVLYYGGILAIVIVVYQWMRRILRLQREQNDLLKELIKKMESR